VVSLITEAQCPSICNAISGGTVIGGDGGFAYLARINSPRSIVVDSARDIYIVDDNNLRIRKVEAATGIINTVAGNGTFGNSGDDSPAVTAQNSGNGSRIAVDRRGNLYLTLTVIADGQVCHNKIIVQ
jgi:hypothetical protein